MPIISTRYRIDRRMNISIPGDFWIRNSPRLPEEGKVSMDIAESYYEAAREKEKHETFRLVAIEEREVRNGRGRVYL